MANVGNPTVQLSFCSNFSPCFDSLRCSCVTMPQGKQCSPKTLQEIEVHLENELSELEVAGAVGVSRGVIQNVIRRLQNGSSDYKRRPGRGRKTTTRTDQHIEFAVLQDRQVTLRELQADLTVVTGQPVSHSLISR